MVAGYETCYWSICYGLEAFFFCCGDAGNNEMIIRTSSA